MLYLTHGNILATVHQKASVNYVVEIKTYLIVGKTLIDSVKFCHDGAEFEWWSELEEAGIYAGFKQISLSAGKYLVTFRILLTE